MTIKMESEGYFVDKKIRAGQRESEREQVWLLLFSCQDLFLQIFKNLTLLPCSDFQLTSRYFNSSMKVPFLVHPPNLSNPSFHTFYPLFYIKQLTIKPNFQYHIGYPALFFKIYLKRVNFEILLKLPILNIHQKS